jgi:hypothetical protein
VGGVTAPSTITAPAVAATTTNRVVAFDHGDDGDEVDGEAPVTSLVAGTSCPSLGFMIGDFKISVTSATRFEGGTCADIKPGARLEVQGIKTGTNIAASKIEFEQLAPTTPPGTPTTPPATQPVEGEGTVTSVTAGSACPALQFQVGTFSVKVDATTIFERGTCADIKVGMKVHVKGGMNRTTSSVLATRIAVQTDNSGPGHPDHPVIEGEARVTSLMSGTSCPALTFQIEEWTVSVDASTAFVSGTCASIKPGTKLGVKGVITAEHTVLASSIVVKND